MKTSTRPPARVTTPSRSLDVFDSPTKNDFIIQIQVPEFTCHCPLTGQPDFAHIGIEYVPNKQCVELKSLKLYMWSFRDIGAFHEKVTNDILADLVDAIAPRFMRVTSRWWVRGGIYTNVQAEHRAKGWKGTPPPSPNWPLAAPFV